MIRRPYYLICLALWLVTAGCDGANRNQTNNNSAGSPSPAGAVAVSQTPSPTVAKTQPVTLPVLDAFFADQDFSNLLQSQLNLTSDQIAKLKDLARAETAKLSEASSGQSEGETAEARQAELEKVSAVIGTDKAAQLSALVRDRWNNGPTPGSTPAEKSTSPGTNPLTEEEFTALAPNTVPTDTRIIVNAPAFRMDVFQEGHLIKSYKIGIGYPQFPLPTALRKARTIIFNPTWTPPDEPWVAKMKDIAVGQKVEAGSELNPLGPIKIPIGLPSLIHGGKPQSKIGTFASHGCVGLTTAQVRDFAKLLAQVSGSQLTDAALARYARDKTQTKQLKLERDVPVELRYETIVVEDGKLHIYRDVYDEDTNSEDELRAVLAVYGIKLEDLSADEQSQIFDALSLMAGKSTRKISRPVAVTSPSPLPAASLGPSPSPKTAARKVQPKKNAKEIVIEIPALSGKGYPAPVEFDTGSGRAIRKQVAIR